MPDITCPVCQNVVSSDGSSVAVCAACGFDLSTATPLPGWVVKGIDLRAVARRQRLLLWFVLAALVVQFLPAALRGLHPLTLIPALVFVFGVQVTIVVGVVQMLAALRTHIVVRILYIVLLFAPCVNLLMLLVANQQATRAMRKAGLRVGFMGVKDEQVVRLLGLYRCRKCSYSLIGNTSGVCPECGTPTSAAPVERAAGAQP